MQETYENFHSVQTAGGELLVPGHAAPQEGSKIEVIPDEMAAQKLVIGTNGLGSLRSEENKNQDQEEKLEHDIDLMLDPNNVLDLKAAYDSKVSKIRSERDLEPDKRTAISKEDVIPKDLKDQMIDSYVQKGADKNAPRDVPEKVKNQIKNMMNLSYEELESRAAKLAERSKEQTQLADSAKQTPEADSKEPEPLTEVVPAVSAAESGATQELPTPQGRLGRLRGALRELHLKTTVKAYNAANAVLRRERRWEDLSEKQQKRREILSRAAAVMALAGAGYLTYRLGGFGGGSGHHAKEVIGQTGTHIGGAHGVASTAIPPETGHAKDLIGDISAATSHDATHELGSAVASKFNLNDLTWNVAHQLKPGHEVPIMDKALRAFNEANHTSFALTPHEGTTMIIDHAGTIINSEQMHALNKLMVGLA